MEDNMVNMVVENDKAVTDNDMLYYASKYGTVPQKCERCRTSKNDSVRG